MLGRSTRALAARLAHRPVVHRLSRASSSAAAPDAAATLSRWSVRLAHDNTFLSYTRNAIICTVAGGALVQYHKAQGRPPLAGTGLLLMGGLFMYGGSALYLYQVSQLQVLCQASTASVVASIGNAFWPSALWTTSLLCLLDETPAWLLEGLRRVEAHLPTALRASLFLDPPALYPVCRLLSGVIAFEETRLGTARHHARGGWSLVKPIRAPLTDLDVVTIIARRLERLELLQATLSEYARSHRAVPTASASPLLDKAAAEVEQLAKVLEADMAPQADTPPPVWWVLTRLSAEHKRLRDETQACRALLRRIVAVKFTSAEFAARGQAGVRPAPPEERALEGKG